METTVNDQFNQELMHEPARPQFLKVLCILSFIACGLMIIIYAIGTMCLALDSDAISGVWEKVIEANPKLEDVDPVVFVHQFGMVCFYSLLTNIISLVGVILMWRLQKIGLIIYAIAEITSNFFSISLDANEETKSYSGLIFGIVIDLVFIGMYVANLKYMNRNSQPAPTNQGF